MAFVAGNLGGGVGETFANRYGGQVADTISTPVAPVVVCIQEALKKFPMQAITPTEMVRTRSRTRFQQSAEIPQVGPFAVVIVAVPPPPAANFKSQGDFVSLVNEYIEPPATKTPSNLDGQALLKEAEITAPKKIQRAVSCPGRISNVFATNFPCLCDNWSVPAAVRTVCKFGSRGGCHDNMKSRTNGSAPSDCRRCHSDRCGAFYLCFQDGMYRRTKKQKLSRQARRKRNRDQQPSQEPTAGDHDKNETDIPLAIEVRTAAITVKA